MHSNQYRFALYIRFMQVEAALPSSEVETCIDGVHSDRRRVATFHNSSENGAAAIADHDDPDGCTYVTATSYDDAVQVGEG